MDNYRQADINVCPKDIYSAQSKYRFQVKSITFSMFLTTASKVTWTEMSSTGGVWTLSPMDTVQWTDDISDETE